MRERYLRACRLCECAASQRASAKREVRQTYSGRLDIPLAVLYREAIVVATAKSRHDSSITE